MLTPSLCSALGASPSPRQCTFVGGVACPSSAIPWRSRWTWLTHRGGPWASVRRPSRTMLCTSPQARAWMPNGGVAGYAASLRFGGHGARGWCSRRSAPTTRRPEDKPPTRGFSTRFASTGRRCSRRRAETLRFRFGFWLSTRRHEIASSQSCRRRTSNGACGALRARRRGTTAWGTKLGEREARLQTRLSAACSATLLPEGTFRTTQTMRGWWFSRKARSRTAWALVPRLRRR